MLEGMSEGMLKGIEGLIKSMSKVMLGGMSENSLEGILSCVTIKYMYTCMLERYVSRYAIMFSYINIKLLKNCAIKILVISVITSPY